MFAGPQVLGLAGPEHFPSLLPVSSFDDQGMSLAMATTAGGLKRTPLAAFANIKRGGLAAIKLAKVATTLSAVDCDDVLHTVC
jgi:DNA gyrase/topoisomerase IV subunit A